MISGVGFEEWGSAGRSRLSAGCFIEKKRRRTDGRPIITLVKRPRLQVLCGAIGLIIVAAVGVSGSRLAAGSSPTAHLEPGPGVMLIASAGLLDPNFHETVVFLIDHGPEEGAIGVIVNRPTEVTVADVASKTEMFAAREDHLFQGGPVEAGRLTVLLYSDGDLPGTRSIAADIRVVEDEAAMTSAFERNVPPDRIRLFAGYAGWAPGQLEVEIARGGWHLAPAQSRWVFSTEPEKVWDELLRIVFSPIA